MKRLIAMTVLGFCGQILMAQISSPFSKPVAVVWAQTAEIKQFAAGQDADKLYLYQRPTDNSRKASENNLYVFDKESLDFSNISISIPPRFQYIGSINRESDMIVLYQVDDPKAGVIGLYSDVIDKSSQSAKVTGQCLVSFVSDSKDYPFFKTSISPNGKYYAVTFMIIDKKEKLKNMYGVVLDQEGKLIWGHQIDLSFPNPEFSTEDMQVSNDGTIYIPAYSMTVKNNKASNVQLHLIQAKGDQLNMNTIDVDFGALQHAKALVLKNGDIFVGGYYSQSYQALKDEAIGYYGYRFNPEKSEYTVTGHTEFPADYRQNKVSAMVGLVLANQQYEISCDYMFELDNGNIVMTGEHKFIRSIRDINNMVSYIHLNKNILVSTFSTGGQSQFTMIEKSQGANHSKWIDDYHDLFLSYTAFADKNEVYFIYNDHADNVPYPGDRSFCETYSIKINKNIKGVCTILSPKGEISQKELMSASQTNQQLYRLQFVDDAFLYVVGATKSGYCLDKFAR